MNEVEVIDRAEIVRREVDRESMERALAVMDPAVLDTVFTSRDPHAVAKRIAEVSTALMEAVRQRDLARRYGDNQNEFLHIEAWQYLATQLSMTVVGVGEERTKDPDGWMAWAELRHVATGRTLGARPGICDRSEPGKQRAPHNTLLQMAHLRAARNATRSVLGFIPRIGGFEISDPDAPATKDHLAKLHILERELGFDHDTIRDELGISSFTELTRDQAHELIVTWEQLRDNVKAGVGDQARSSSAVVGSPFSGELERQPSDQSDAASTVKQVASDQGAPEDRETTLAYGEGAAEPPDDSGAPTTLGELWKRAATAGLTSNKAKAFARSIGIKVQSASDLDVEQMQRVLAAWEKRAK